MHYQNLEQLKRLRLFGMARALEELPNLADRGQMNFADQLALLIDREATDRELCWNLGDGSGKGRRRIVAVKSQPHEVKQKPAAA